MLHFRGKLIRPPAPGLWRASRAQGSADSCWEERSEEEGAMCISPSLLLEGAWRHSCAIRLVGFPGPVPMYACCPSLIIYSILLHSLQHSSLDEKLYGPPRWTEHEGKSQETKGGIGVPPCSPCNLTAQASVSSSENWNNNTHLATLCVRIT